MAPSPSGNNLYVAFESLPPPDPHESPLEEPDGQRFAPTKIFLGGQPDAAAQRLADAILNVRPGLLIVFARD